MSRSLERLSIALLVIAITIPLIAHPHGHDYEWAFTDGDHELTVSTSRASSKAAKRLAKEIDVPFIWLRHDGREYVITDPETVEKAREIFEGIGDLDDLEIEIEMQTADLEREIERSVEAKMEKFEVRMAEIEELVERGSFAALDGIDDAIADLDLEGITEMARNIEVHAGRIEAWAHQLEERIDGQAIPLFEEAIRSGKAKALR